MDEDEVIVYCCTRAKTQMAGTNPMCRKLDTGEMVCKTCPICMEALFDDVAVLPCGHAFHEKCLVRNSIASGDLKCALCKLLTTFFV